jgi:hypothetical protein
VIRPRSMPLVAVVEAMEDHASIVDLRNRRSRQDSHNVVDSEVGRMDRLEHRGPHNLGEVVEVVREDHMDLLRSVSVAGRSRVGAIGGHTHDRNSHLADHDGLESVHGRSREETNLEVVVRGDRSRPLGRVGVVIADGSSVRRAFHLESWSAVSIS